MNVMTWTQVAEALASRPAGARVRVRRPEVEHPLDAGLRLTLGTPVGQRADFMRERLHVQDFGTHYEARLVDGAAASSAPIPPAAAAGALLGLLLCGTREAALVVALLGAATLRE
jgi:hypothetical protein